MNLSEAIKKLNQIKSISHRAIDLEIQDVIDDAEELMDAYMEEMPVIYKLSVEALELLQ